MNSPDLVLPWLKLFASIAAIIVGIVFSLLKFRNRFCRPFIIARTFEYFTSSSVNHRGIRLEQPDSPSKWLISKVFIDGSSDKWLRVENDTDESLRNEGHAKFDAWLDLIDARLPDNSTVAWEHSVNYEFPISDGYLVLHADAPDDLWLSITAVLRSNHRVKRSVKIPSTYSKDRQYPWSE